MVGSTSKHNKCLEYSHLANFLTPSLHHFYFIYCRPSPCLDSKDHSQQRIRTDSECSCQMWNPYSQKSALLSKNSPLLSFIFCLLSSMPAPKCDTNPTGANGSAFLIPLVYQLFPSRAETVFSHPTGFRPVTLQLMRHLGQAMVSF